MNDGLWASGNRNTEILGSSLEVLGIGLGLNLRDSKCWHCNQNVMKAEFFLNCCHFFYQKEPYLLKIWTISSGIPWLSIWVESFGIGLRLNLRDSVCWNCNRNVVKAEFIFNCCHFCTQKEPNISKKDENNIIWTGIPWLSIWVSSGHVMSWNLTRNHVMAYAVSESGTSELY